MSKQMLIILFFLTSCLPNTTNITNKLYYRQPREEVVKVFGKPNIVQGFYDKEILVYYLYESIFDLIFTSRKIPYLAFYPLIRTGNPYYIILENNKVVSFGFSNNFHKQIPKLLQHTANLEIITTN